MNAVQPTTATDSGISAAAIILTPVASIRPNAIALANGLARMT